MHGKSTSSPRCAALQTGRHRWRVIHGKNWRRITFTVQGDDLPVCLALGPESSLVRGEDSDLLGRPVLAEAGDELALEDEDGDLSHSLADFLGQVVELGFPFNNSRISIEVEIQQLTLNIALRFDDF